MSFALFTLSAAAVAAAATEVSSKEEASFFTELALDQAMWDALLEGVLALLVFGAASTLMGTYRKRTSKKLGTQKAKLSAKAPHAKQASGCAEVAKLFAKSYTSGEGTEADAKRMPIRSPNPAGSTKTAATREADAIASAVRADRASELPKLLDAALTRLLATSASEPAPAMQAEVATALLHSALRACASARRFSEAIAAYDHLAERVGEGNAGLWSVLLYCIVEAGAFCRCSFVFERLCAQGSASPHDFVNMVRCFAGKQDFDGLSEMLKKLRSSGQTVDTYTWNRALAACAHAECSLELAEELARAGICPEGLDAVGYNTLMKYNARACNLSRCLELHAEMKSKGLEASEVTFGILLDACVYTKELDSARKVFDELCGSGLRLNVVHCTTFIKGLVAANKLDEAAGVLREMAQSPGVKPDLITYSTIVKAYADAGNVASSLKMLEQMLGEGVRPDEIIYNSVLTGCCVFPLKSAHVMHTFDKLISIGMRPTTTTLSILLKALAHTDAWTASLDVLNEASTRFGFKPEMRLYAQLAQACVKARPVGPVLEIFHSMLKASRSQSTPIDPLLAGRFIRSCLLGGSLDMALELREAARRAGVTVDTNVDKMLKNALAKKSRP